MRGAAPGLVEIPMPELVRARNDRRAQGTVFMRALRPRQIGTGVNPQSEAH